MSTVPPQQRLAHMLSGLARRPTARAEPEVALIVGGGPGVSASCARLLAEEGMMVGVACRTPGKEAMKALADAYPSRLRIYGADASNEAAVAQLFDNVSRDFGQAPRLVIHNIDGAACFGRS